MVYRTVETSGSAIREDQARELSQDGRVLCLGQVMNFKDFAAARENSLIKGLIRMCKGGKGDARTDGTTGRMKAKYSDVALITDDAMTVIQNRILWRFLPFQN